MFAEVEDQVEGRLVLVELGGLRSTDLDLEKELDRNIVNSGKLQVHNKIIRNVRLNKVG